MMVVWDGDEEYFTVCVAFPRAKKNVTELYLLLVSSLYIFYQHYIAFTSYCKLLLVMLTSCFWLQFVVNRGEK